MKNILTKLTTSLLFGAALISNSILPNSTSINLQSLLADDYDLAATIETTETTETSSSEYQFTTPLIIKALNPGYTVDSVRDVGELVELQLTTDTTPFPLAGYALRYVNSNAKSTTLIEFSEGSSMVGEFLLLRLSRKNSTELADAFYSTTIAMGEGTLQLWYEDEIVDQVCWSKSETCVTPFSSSTPTTLVRDSSDGEFKHQSTYEVHYDAEHPSLVLTETEDSDTTQTDSDQSDTDDSTQSPTQSTDADTDDDTSSDVSSSAKGCKGMEFTEIFSYYAEDKSEQFIELYNGTDEVIDLTGCSLRYKKKTYPLSGEVNPDSYLAFYPANANPSFSLTKNPSTTNEIELLNVDDEVVDLLVYEHGQKKSTSMAKFVDETNTEIWERTYAITPGADNIYQEFQTCPEGKVINESTGNCIKVTSTSVTKQTTTSSTTSTELAACPEGKYRNPLTGRCKKIEDTTSELKPCAEGYERNPDTNRCRKVTSENDGETYALVPATYSDSKTFVALGVVLLLVSVGVVYIILQFRHEIARAARKARQRLHHIRKDLIARCARFHRHK